LEKTWLYVMNGLYFLLSAFMLFMAIKYAFINEVLNGWFSVFLVGIIGTVSTFLSRPKRLTFQRMMITYALGLIIISGIVFVYLPSYTYEEAEAVIIDSTGENILKTDEPKTTIGYYVIYTNNGVYVFNAGNGDFAKRD